MINRRTTYIDTAQSGLVVQIQHNFNGMVYPQFYTVNTSGHKIFMSLYSSPIAEAKALDGNTFQVSFSGAFEGFVDLLYFDIKTPSQGNRITHLEKDVAEIRDTLTDYVNGMQWRQMNTYLEKQIKDLNKEINDLQQQVVHLQQELSKL